ncbi:MAG: hypothetical protein JXR39_01265 [Marinilabiliaceae bacterium]|nr:hypothetical protein [Marinilabiliaceae bacterium]
MILITYVLLPLLGLLFLLLGMLIAGRHKWLSNKKFVVLILVVFSLLFLPGLVGFIDYGYMPWGYLVLLLYYLILGSIYTALMGRFLPQGSSQWMVLLMSITLTLAGMGCFSLIFNLSNEMPYGLWASTPILAFLIPFLFVQTGLSYLSIPLEVYQVWQYSKSGDITGYESIDYHRLKVYEVELFKQESDREPVTINAKAPDEMPFGVWFRRLITDYNRKSPLLPIEIHDSRGESGWIFYVKPSILQARRYLDFHKTFQENRIAERSRIVAKRVKEQVITE